MFFHQSSVRRVLPLKETKKKNKNARASSVVCLALHTTYSACVHTKYFLRYFIRGVLALPPTFRDTDLRSKQGLTDKRQEANERHHTTTVNKSMILHAQAHDMLALKLANRGRDNRRIDQRVPRRLHFPLYCPTRTTVW